MSLDPLLLTPAPGRGSVPDTETGRLLRATDWSGTPLGPIAGWPLSLRIAVAICLNSRFPMFVWWGPSHVNIYNDAYVPMLGQRHPQAFGRPAREAWDDIWAVLTPQIEAVMQRGESSWNERVMLLMERRGFPEETYFTWSYSPIYDEHGAIGGLYCAVMEETPRIAAERARDALMREAQDTAATLQTWFEQAPGFVALLRGPRMVFEMVNKAYLQLVGHRPIQGRPLYEALPEVREQGFAGILERVYASGEPFVGRGMRALLQKEPQAPPVEAFVDLVYQPVFDAEGRVTGIFVQGHDVTEQWRAVQALEQADRRKDEFLATLAHELRNPLAPIRQAARLAHTAGVTPAQHAWALDVIERQARHMGLLLDDLLDVSRISQGRLELRREPVALASVVEAAVETVRPLIEQRRHRLTLELPREPVVLSADPLRLAQVLSNLLSNAAKYTDEGGAIAVRAAVEGPRLVIAVRDSGIGLTPASREHIFEMFSQVSSALDRAEGGLGIGLALSRGLVQLHGGTIEARSAGLGQGSEFVVRVPLAAAGSPQASPATTPTPQAAPRRVLIADDNADAADSLALMLQLEGHEVRTTRDGREALAAAEAWHPDVAVLDIGMPGLNGYDVARAIRAAPWGGQMMLIAVTGWGQADDRARATAAGFDHHCTKPVEPQQLDRLIAGAAPR